MIAGLWVLVLIGVVLAITVTPAAINMAAGLAITAVAVTIATDGQRRR